MKKLIPSAAAFFIAFFCSNVNGQVDQGTLPGTGDKDLTDRNSKDRSFELERVKRDMYKEGSRPEKTRQLNFTEIKKDFEQIQLVFDERIVKTYRSTDPIDYRRISDGSDEIRDRAARLKVNLFFERTKKGPDRSHLGDVTQRQEIVKKLIVNLNEALGRLVTNPIFRHPSVIDPKDSEMAKADLNQIILLSSQLSQTGVRQK